MSDKENKENERYELQKVRDAEDEVLQKNNVRVVSAEEFAQAAEVNAAFVAVCRPCTWCGKIRTGLWCDECEDKFSELLPNGMEVVGRPLCSKCEDKYDRCKECYLRPLWCY